MVFNATFNNFQL